MVAALAVLVAAAGVLAVLVVTALLDLVLAPAQTPVRG